MKTINKIEQIDQLIRMKATGKPKDFADKLGISESTLYRYLNEMRDHKAPISFDKIKNTYYYCENGKFNTGFVFIDNIEMQNIKGGKNVAYLFATVK
jgi:hypothetical protein